MFSESDTGAPKLPPPLVVMSLSMKTYLKDRPFRNGKSQGSQREIVVISALVFHNGNEKNEKKKSCILLTPNLDPNFLAIFILNLTCISHRFSFPIANLVLADSTTDPKTLQTSRFTAIRSLNKVALPFQGAVKQGIDHQVEFFTTERGLLEWFLGNGV